MFYNAKINKVIQNLVLILRITIQNYLLLLKDNIFIGFLYR